MNQRIQAFPPLEVRRRPTPIVHGASLEKRLGLVVTLAVGLFLVLGLGTSHGAPAPGAPQEREDDLFKLSIEELLDFPVSLVTRSDEAAMQTPAAVTSITAEEIEASGLTTIPELLRLAPGVTVGRIDANKWAISIRGFAHRFASNLLVMIDNRYVYTPLFSGTYWEVQDTFLEDIDRIEVVRGPGGALWGSNAINGIINIVTKDAKHTQGVNAYALAGYDDAEAAAGMRYGGRAGAGHFRIYGKYDRYDSGQVLGPDQSRNEGLLPIGDEAQDDWQRGQLGGRLDHPLGGGQLTVLGDGYLGRLGQTRIITTGGAPPAADEDEVAVHGANLGLRWRRALGERAELTLRGYYDLTFRSDASFKETLNTGSFDAQASHRLGDVRTYKLTGGLSYRVSHDDTATRGAFALDPAARTLDWIGAFAQCEAELIDQRLWLTAGSKVEHNDFTGLELMPSVRALLRPAAAVSAWAAVTRAVHLPSRADSDATVEAAPGMVNPIGNPNLDAEVMWAYEIGGRWLVRNWLSIDLAGFTQSYDRFFRLLDTSENKGTAVVYGAELAANWQVTSPLLVRLQYALMRGDLEADTGMGPMDMDGLLGGIPQHQLSVRGALRLGRKWGFDLAGYYMSSAHMVGLPVGEIPARFRLDARALWHVLDRLSVELVGQNLTDPVHLEETERGRLNTGVERSAYLRVRFVY